MDQLRSYIRAIGDHHLKNQSRSYASPKSDNTEAFDTKDSEGQNRLHPFKEPQFRGLAVRVY